MKGSGIFGNINTNIKEKGNDTFNYKKEIFSYNMRNKENTAWKCTKLQKMASYIMLLPKK